jgi:Ca2+/Na+ antiporter
MNKSQEPGSPIPSRPPAAGDGFPADPQNFSLVLGGPLYQLLVRSHLATPALELMKRRIAFISLFAWLPLLLLSLADGKAWGGAGLPFLYDFEMQARFLVALPLFIAAELLVHQRLRLVVGQFMEREIIPENVLPQFKESIASAMRLRNSVAIELALFILIFVGGHYFWNSISSIAKIGTDAGTWYATTTQGGTHPSPAGYWYMFISRPLFQFIMVRWYFRLFIWARFLWQCSRLELNLIPTHPDRAAGLGFLGMSSAAFTPLLAANGALLAGLMANPIFFAGAKLTEFKMEILGMVVLLLLIVLGPLFFFSPCLMSAKRTGLREYGRLASRYARDFDHKWVRGGAPEGEPLLGSGDIQSLADLGNSFQVIREIKPFPFGKDTVIQLVVLTLLPVLPLVLTMIPLEELITKLVGAVF